jgi:hypothetical protein
MRSKGLWPLLRNALEKLTVKLLTNRVITVK